MGSPGGAGTASLSPWTRPFLGLGHSFLCGDIIFSGVTIQLRGFSLEAEGVVRAGTNLQSYRGGSPVITTVKDLVIVFLQ